MISSFSLKSRMLLCYFLDGLHTQFGDPVSVVKRESNLLTHCVHDDGLCFFYAVEENILLYRVLPK